MYVDVDNRYYNPLWYYEPIDIQPGYQLLSGADALDYVRFRHDRNMDFGRMERQQRFMAALREQAMGWDLPFKLPGLISALFQNITTDLDANEILRLAKWGVGLNGDSIRGITLRGSTPTINGAAYVVASEDQIARAVTKLLYQTAPDESEGATDSTTVAGAGGAGGSTSTTGSTSSTTSTSTTVPADLSGISLDVKGADGRAGEAAAAAKWLQSLGATVVTNSDSAAAGPTAERRRVSDRDARRCQAYRRCHRDRQGHAEQRG